MKIIGINAIGLLVLTCVFISCNEQPEKASSVTQESPVEQHETVGLVENVLTAEEQKALTPDMVVQSFKEGNSRFMRNDLTARNHSEQVRKSTNAQYPKAIVLSCVDSRVPVEDVFDRGIGEANNQTIFSASRWKAHRLVFYKEATFK